MDSTLENSLVHSRTRQYLTDEQRLAIYEALLTHSAAGKLKRGTLKSVAALFSINTKTARRIWKRGNAYVANGLVANVCNQLPGKVGRKRIQLDTNEAVKVKLRRRNNIRSFAKELNMAKSTLHRRVKEGMIRPHSNALKPYLSEENKKARLQFCVSMIDSSTLQSQPMFRHLYDFVHIDEKWFFLTKESERFYLLPEEEDPHRTCKSKRFITKVMFLAAVARPRFDEDGNELFFGKIGIFPFTYQEHDKRSSKNRVAGTLETKAIITVNKDVFRSCLIEKVLPAIQSKWPRSGTSTMDPIYVQLDNAKPHILPTDSEFIEATTKDGFDIRFRFQPPNSPDLNVLDLGYFRAIQSLQYQEAPTTVDELVHAVQKSFDELSSESLNHVFLTLQASMIEVMKVYGGINYKLPHMGKHHLLRNGTLPSQCQCEPQVLQNALTHLQQ